MIGRRILTIRKIETIERVDGAIYNSVNQDNILSRFENWYPAASFTYLLLNVEKDPIGLEISSLKYCNLIKSRMRHHWLKQTCLQFGHNYISPYRILNPCSNHYRVWAADLCHVLAHTLLPLALHVRTPIISMTDLESCNFVPQELVYVNKKNPLETYITFNFSTDLAATAQFASIIIDYLSNWAMGEMSTGFKDRIARFGDFTDDRRFITRSIKQGSG